MSNFTNILGRLTKDPELKGEGDRTYWYLSVADNQRKKVGEEWEDDPQFFNCFAPHQNKRIEAFEKGDLLSVWGTLKLRKDGENQVNGVTINIDKVERVMSKGAGSREAVAATSTTSASSSSSEDDYDPFDN